MLIGAIIGLFLSLAWTMVTFCQLTARADEHNSNKLSVALHGIASVKMKMFPIVLEAICFASAGAIIGHFVG